MCDGSNAWTVQEAKISHQTFWLLKSGHQLPTWLMGGKTDTMSVLYISCYLYYDLAQSLDSFLFLAFHSLIPQALKQCVLYEVILRRKIFLSLSLGQHTPALHSLSIPGVTDYE